MAHFGKKSLLCGILLLLLILASSCSSIGYYAHSIKGHLGIMHQRQAIDEILSSSTNEELKTKLRLALAAREFASNSLALPKNNSYKTYVDINRPYVVWNVVATEEFSFEPKQWCFLVVGCVQYRGYYSKEKANQLADKLRAQGLDVSVSGAIAYSTLGWFDDPLLNTMIQWSDAAIAEFIFHELAHQQIYINGDSEFNEAFATAVGEKGAELWLQNQSEAMQKYKHGKQLYQKFLSFIGTTRKKLDQLYQEDLGDERKRHKKALILKAFYEEFQQAKIQDPLFSKFDRWFDSDLNNAKFALISTYRNLVPAFNRLLQQEKDFTHFYKKVKSLGKMPLKKRHAYLQSLLSDAEN